MNLLYSLGWLLFWSSVTNGVADEGILFRKEHIEVKKTDLSYVADKYEYRPYHMLLLGGINRGNNILKPENKNLWNDPKHDFSRLATTYYHRNGPFGQVMEQYNWFPGPENTYAADCRLPASLVGLGARPLGNLRGEQLMQLWSEPPLAVIGMYAGTPASYARLFQPIHFYENNLNIINLSLPKKGKPYFHYVRDAKQRGANVEVFPGEERKSLETKAPENFYQVILVEICPRKRLQDLSVELLTKEGMALMFDKLREDGILCYHTSNRYIDIVPVITDVAGSLGLAVVQGQDALFTRGHHFTSQWVMVARKKEYLDRLPEPENYMQKVKESNRKWGYFYKPTEPFWSEERPTGKHVWTDASHHSLQGLWRSDPFFSELGSAWDQFSNKTFRPVFGDQYASQFNPFRAMDSVGIGIREYFNQSADDLRGK